MAGKTRSLPVLMHHYVSDYVNSIAVSPAIFENQCRVMAEKGWRGISLEEAEGYFLSQEPLPSKSALITFDDGYLDNYFYAAPILKKFGHHGVMFAVTDRLEPQNDLRADFACLLAGNIPQEPELHALSRPNAAGFMQRHDVFCNHGEVRFMDQEGTMAIAGHSRSHLGVFIGPEYKSINKPGPQGRTFYLTPEGTVWGLPKFAVKPGLASRAFIPDQEFIERIKELVPQDLSEATAFFADKTASRALDALLEKFQGRMGRLETDQERQERMFLEIAIGKEELESILGHTVQTLCWPWGAYDSTSLRIAQEAGYKVFITTKPGVNLPGQSLAVCRFKVRSRDASWLMPRLRVYASPFWGKVYAKIR